ncbi:MAG: transcriptional regulator NrdR [Clostridia bacterium]|nr:transcriptional regulator NrdR [Clostridia bacterium]
MKCPFCNSEDTRVVDSRSTDDGHAIRRRRICDSCDKRFTTYEKVERTLIMVVKKDGSRQAFDGDKLVRGILKSCEKRPVTVGQVEELVADVERQLANTMEKEVESSYVGELVMDKLKDLDQVAYVRFASVYRQFTDVNTFVKEIEKLLGDK